MRKYSTLLIKQVVSFVWLLYNFNTRNKLSNEGVFYHCIGIQKNVFLCSSYSHSYSYFFFFFVFCFIAWFLLLIYISLCSCCSNQRTNGILKNKRINTKNTQNSSWSRVPCLLQWFFLFCVYIFYIYFQVFFFCYYFLKLVYFLFCYFGNNWKQQQGKIISYDIKKRGNQK